MTKQDAKKKIDALRQTLRQHDYRYYVLDHPEISDLAYDKLYKALQTFEADFPELITADSPTQRVGGQPVEGFAPVKHRVPMLSLDNTYNEEELAEWDARVRKGLGEAAPEYIVEPKIDGVSSSLVYENG